jgi:cyclic pyranopterin phosphate synthase
LGIQNIGITSNGLILSNQLDNLVAAGLNSVNISLDTLIAEKFGDITRRESKNLYKVLSSIYSSLGKGLNVKINCVLMRGINCDEISSFVALTKNENIDVRFIELMPFDDNNFNPSTLVTYIEAISRLKDQVNFRL